MINNSTTAYKKAAELQDQAGDEILKAQWRVNKLSTASVTSYNTLADRKNKLDAQFSPPMTTAQYSALSSSYATLKSDADTYIAASSSAQESVFGVGNVISRASVDGAMAIVSSMTPVSFKTRQSLAKYVPPLVLAAVDLSLLAAALLVFVGAFYYFRGFFRSKLVLSGWALTMLGFVFLLLVGSVGFYSIVMSTEKFTSFTDFMGTVQGADRVAVIVEETGSPAVTGMHACADQIEAQMKAQGKATLKYYINGNGCTSVLPRTVGNNSSAVAYDTKPGLIAANCLDSIPDVPIFDLQYTQTTQAPAFTTVVTKQAIVKGNEAYYGKKQCDIANVLG
ncbi:Uncharacterised protein [uncultured archaeon]|nr:Uncharacterised protein [uncultured archaeon]